MPENKDVKKLKDREMMFTINNTEIANLANYTSQLDAINNFSYPSLEEGNSFKLPSNNDVPALNTTDISVDNVSFDMKDNSPVFADTIESRDIESEEDDLKEEENELQILVNERFESLIAKDREQSQKFTEDLKKAHPNDYDKYVEKLRKTRYYKKCLEKWKKYYTELKQKCAEEIKTEIEADAIDAAFGKAEEVKPNLDLNAENNAQVAMSPIELGSINANNKSASQSKKFVDEPQKPELQPNVDEIDTSKYTPLATDGKMLVDKNLQKTVQDVLLDSLYESFDEISDYYGKLSSQASDKKKDNDLVEFRAQLADTLQQIHNKIIPNQSELYMPSVRTMQKNIENHIGKRNAKSSAELYFDKLYHVDAKTAEESGFIPELSQMISERLQDILISNGVIDFNISKENVRALVDKLMETSQLGEDLKFENANGNGLIECVDLLVLEIKSIRDGTFTYTPKKLALIKDKINAFVEINPKEKDNYTKLLTALEDISKCEEELTLKGIKLSECKDVMVKTLFKDAVDKLKFVKDYAKVTDALNKKSDSKLTTETNKIKGLFDFMTVDFIKNASAANKKDNLDNFAIEDGDIHQYMARCGYRFAGDEYSKIIGADVMDFMSISAQEWLIKSKEPINSENNRKISKFIDELSEMASILEKDEKKLASGKAMKEDSADFAKHQRHAKALINDYTHLYALAPKKKTNLKKEDIEKLEF